MLWKIIIVNQFLIDCTNIIVLWSLWFYENIKSSFIIMFHFNLSISQTLFALHIFKFSLDILAPFCVQMYCKHKNCITTVPVRKCMFKKNWSKPVCDFCDYMIDKDFELLVHKQMITYDIHNWKIFFLYRKKLSS